MAVGDSGRTEHIEGRLYPVKIGFLISGRGSNMTAIIEACEAGEIKGSPALVIANNATAEGLESARKHGIPAIVCDHRQFASRETFESQIIEELRQHQVDVVILAGFMRILTSTLIAPYLGRMLNIHPSLLPKYPGLNTHQRALDAGDRFAGATVHFVIEELDAGPAVIQGHTPIVDNDDHNTLRERVLKIEHQIYPLAVAWLCEGRVQLDGATATFDGQRLPPTGIDFAAG